jgi:hypothetical protein
MPSCSFSHHGRELGNRGELLRLKAALRMGSYQFAAFELSECFGNIFVALGIHPFLTVFGNDIRNTKRFLAGHHMHLLNAKCVAATQDGRPVVRVMGCIHHHRHRRRSFGQDLF